MIFQAVYRIVFQSKKFCRKLKYFVALCLLLVFSIGLAHQGFYQLSKDEVVGNYELSALQDFDIDKNTVSQGQLLLQVSHDGDVVSDDTKVNVLVKFEGEEIRKGEMDYVGGSSQDGKTFYTSYIYTLPITDLGIYSVNFTIAGEYGQAEQQYFFKSTRINSWQSDLAEVIPSAIILIICLIGGALLFLPVKSKTELKTGKEEGEQHV